MESNKSLPPEFFTEKTDMDRKLGLLEAFAILPGRIIGSGIFRAPGPIMILVGCVSMYFGVWILAGIATLLGAFVYAEMAAMIPRSGGPYAFLRAAYSPVWAFLRGWAMFFVSETGAIAAVAMVFAEYLNSIVRLVAGAPLSRGIEVLLALAIIWILTLVNSYGVALSGKVQNFLSMLKLLALGAVIGVCLTKGGNASHFSQSLWPEHFTWASILALGAAMRYAFFAFSGWEGATYVAEEVKNPRKNLPLSLIVGLTGITLIYLATNTAYLYQIPVARIMDAQGSKWVAVEAMEAAVGGLGGILVSLAVMLNTFGSVNAQVLVKARSVFAMARDGLFIGYIGKLHPKYKTPNRALILQAIWATVLLIGAAFAAHVYETIIDFFSFTSSIFNISTFAAVWVLRKKYPDAPRAYRAWGYPVTLILVLAIQIWFMVTTLITAFIPSMCGILLTSTGLIYYYRADLMNWLRRTLRLSAR